MNKKLKSKKANTNTGITLIALILTIVVLLILAVVAIQAVQGDGILAHAKNARAEYQNAQNNEAATLQNYTDYIAEQSGNNPTGGEIYLKAKVNTIVEGKYNATMNGKAPSASNPIIPVGFAPINTETSSWGNGSGTPDENSVKNGLVITDSIDEGTKASNGNEFVWIPVNNVNDMVMCQEHGTKTILDKTTLECPECKQATKLAGKLYGTEGDIDKPVENYKGNLDEREPDVVTYGDEEEDRTGGSKYDAVKTNLIKVLDDEHKKNLTAASFKDQLQKEFEKMAKSVAKYGGFYVGRYEISDKGASKKGGTSLGVPYDTTYDWYSLYREAKKYAQENSNITSEMIWGCQWDAMMRWMQGNNIDVTSTSPTDTGRNKQALYNRGTTTGGAADDRLNNVFDLLGNHIEWTQEACITCFRSRRGGDEANTHFSPSERIGDYPDGKDEFGDRYIHGAGTRATLYVS